MNQGDENVKSIPKRASTKTSIKLNQTSTIPAKNQKGSLRRSSNLNVNISQNSKSTTANTNEREPTSHEEFRNPPDSDNEIQLE
jgi:hypothetical protein